MPVLALLQLAKKVLLRPIEVRLLVHFGAAFPRRHREWADVDAVSFGTLQQGDVPKRGRHRLENRTPRRRTPRRRGLRDVADDCHRPARAATHEHPPGHRRQLLRLVDDDVAVVPGVVTTGTFGHRLLRRRSGVTRGHPVGVDLPEQIAPVWQIPNKRSVKTRLSCSASLGRIRGIQ